MQADLDRMGHWICKLEAGDLDDQIPEDIQNSSVSGSGNGTGSENAVLLGAMDDYRDSIQGWMEKLTLGHNDAEQEQPGSESEWNNMDFQAEEDSCVEMDSEETS